MKGIFTLLAAGSSVVTAISGAFAQQAMMTDQELMDALKDSAPAAVLKDATILNMGADGQMNSSKRELAALFA